MTMHSVSLTLTAKNEEEWNTVFNLLSTVMMDSGQRFDAALSSYETEAPENATHHDENTMQKVYDALIAKTQSEDEATDIINSLQNAGIHFRELKS